jgi:hypothetical protein
MMSRGNIILFFIILIVTISCANKNPQGQEKSTQPPREIKTVDSNQPKLQLPSGETKNYVPGEILIKFYEGTNEKAIQAIKRDLHLETIRVVSKPNLYLMKILNGSSVENVMGRLRGYEEVQYSEPNYLRTKN